MGEIPGTFPLRELYLEITNTCQQRCLFCSTDSGTPYPSGELSIYQLLQLVESAGKLGLEKLYITGGEPLTRPIKTRRVLEKALDLGIAQLSLLTNGQILDREWVSYLRNFRDRLTIEMTVLASQPKIHDSLVMYSKSLNHVLRATNYCVHEDIDVVWEFVVMRPNKDQIEPVIELAEKFGIRSLSILRLMPSGRAAKNRGILELPPHELYSFLTGLHKFNYQVDIQKGAPVNFDFLRFKSSPPSCSAGVKKLLIQADGDTLPCPGFKGLPNFFSGNVKFQSLTDIWLNSPILCELRRFRVGNTVVCPECPFALSCKGHCTAQRLHYYHNLYRGPDPLCPLQKVEVEPCALSIYEL